ncbi:IPT/TIG domain-containing protein, partial [Candidatus Magnetomorum sp. HK-1]
MKVTLKTKFHPIDLHILFIILSICLLLLKMESAYAEIDIRTNLGSASVDAEIAYVASVSDCSELISISFTAGYSTGDISVSDMTPKTNAPNACETTFLGSGDNKLSPKIVLNYTNGSQVSHEESFCYELTRPKLSFQDISFININEKQYLKILVSSQDDVDIQYLGFSVIGLRISVLREVGGVIDIAKERAFAQTSGIEKLYPDTENQESFEFLLEVDARLDDASIAHDGLVMADIIAVDSSGNQTSQSDIHLTGYDAVELVKNLYIKSPERIVFTNYLQSVPIVPVIEFQFRGETPVSGPGWGFEYTSTHPDIVGVTGGGIVYPLKESNDDTIFIRISYPDFAPIEIPVEVNFNKQLISLKALYPDNSNGVFMERLNSYFQVPHLVAVFSDGSQSEINEEQAVEFVLKASAQGIITYDPELGVKSSAVIPLSDPKYLTAQLKATPEICVDIPLTATDAPPEISINLPNQAVVNTNLVVEAEVSDDTGINSVIFYLNGTVISSRSKPPYQLSFQVNEDFSLQTLSFKASVYDTIDQCTHSWEKSVKIIPEQQSTIRDFSFELPQSMQSYIEESVIRFQTSVLIGLKYYPSEITHFDFFIDGKLACSARSKQLEKRKKKDSENEIYYEIFSCDSHIKKISVPETTTSVYGSAFTSEGIQKNTPHKIINIYENAPPSATILSPTPGASLSCGQEIDVVVDISDDTLGMGETITLLKDGIELISFFHKNNDIQISADRNIQQISHTFPLTISKDMIGTSLSIQVQ